MVKFLEISLLNLETIIYFSITHLCIQNTPNVQQSFSQALRIRRICFCESHFVRHLGNMKLWLLEKGCPSDLVESETKKVKFTPNVNNKNIGKSVKGIPFVLTYHLKESHWIRFSLKLCTFYIWTKKWRRFLHQNPWFHSIVPESWATIYWDLICILSAEVLGQRIVILNAVKFLKTLKRHLLELAQSLERSLLLNTSFTVTLDVF